MVKAVETAGNLKTFSPLSTRKKNAQCKSCGLSFI